jgi:hypothetical protein
LRRLHGGMSPALLRAGSSSTRDKFTTPGCFRFGWSMSPAPQDVSDISCGKTPPMLHSWTSLGTHRKHSVFQSRTKARSCETSQISSNFPCQGTQRPRSLPVACRLLLRTLWHFGRKRVCSVGWDPSTPRLRRVICLPSPSASEADSGCRKFPTRMALRTTGCP